MRNKTKTEVEWDQNNTFHFIMDKDWAGTVVY